MVPTTSATGPESIPRPRNKFIIYRAYAVKNLLPLVGPGQPNHTFKETSQLISKLWAQESEATKAHFKQLADAEKEQHQLDYPNYRYTPKSKEVKAHLKKQKEKGREQEKIAKNARGTGKCSQPAKVKASPQQSVPCCTPHPAQVTAASSTESQNPLSTSAHCGYDAIEFLASSSTPSYNPMASSLSSLSSVASTSASRATSRASNSSLPTPPSSAYSPSIDLCMDLNYFNAPSFSAPTSETVVQQVDGTRWHPYRRPPQPAQGVYPAVNSALQTWKGPGSDTTYEQPTDSTSASFNLENEDLLCPQDGGELSDILSSPHDENAYRLEDFDPAMVAFDNNQESVAVSAGCQQAPFLDYEALLLAENEVVDSNTPVEAEYQVFSISDEEFFNTCFNVPVEYLSQATSSSSGPSSFISQPPVASSSYPAIKCCIS